MGAKVSWLGVVGVGMLVLILAAAGTEGFERWFNTLDAPTDGKDDPDTLRDRMSINELRWTEPGPAAHVLGQVELFNGNAFAVRDIRLTCMRYGPGGKVDMSEDLHAAIPGPLAGRTRKVFDAVDLGGALKGASSIGCILTRATRAAPPVH